MSRPTVSVDGADHVVTGAQVALMDERGHVFLQLRPWPLGWELPGGHCGANEEPAAAAQREVEEETGHTVRITQLVGVYTWRGLRHTSDVVYLGQITGGTWRPGIEAIRRRFVSVHDLPATTFPWIHQRVADAVAVAGGAAPVHREQPVTLRHILFFGGSWAGSVVDVVRKVRRARR